MNAISITIVDPNQLFREGLQQLLRKPRFVVAATVRTLAEALGGDGVTIRPDVVILGCSAQIGAVAQVVSARGPGPEARGVRFVFLADTAEMPVLRRAVASGVDAILSKDISTDVLQRSLELIMLGQQLFPASLAQALPERTALPQADLIPFPPAGAVAQRVSLEQHKPAPQLDLASLNQQSGVVLSERESQILCCLVNGSSNKAIARELHITEATVKVHVKGLLRKIRVTNRTQVAIWALQNSRGAGQEASQALEMPLAGAHDRPTFASAVR